MRLSHQKIVAQYDLAAKLKDNFHTAKKKLKNFSGGEELKPIGKGTFGNIYDQFKGRIKEAFYFLLSHKSGDLLGVFHRDGVGDIDLVWGDKGGGLNHILEKHVGEGKSFATIDDAIERISEIINKGKFSRDGVDKMVFRLGNKIVTIRTNVRRDGKKKADKNWVLTAYDEMVADGGNSAISTDNQAKAALSTANSTAKVTTEGDTSKKRSGKSIAEQILEEDRLKRQQLVDDAAPTLEKSGRELIGVQPTLDDYFDMTSANFEDVTEYDGKTFKEK